MVEVIGFLSLGNIFTAHRTGNLVVISAALVRGGPMKLAQVLAVPIFMLAVAAMWLVARVSNRRSAQLVRLFLMIQFLLLTGVFIFSVITKPSADPHGPMAGVAVMIAVSAMACQFALFRLAMPHTISTAVMTGNLTNTVLSLLDTLSRKRPLMEGSADRLRLSLHLLFGFLVGCMIGAVAVSLLGDWAWSGPLVMAGLSFAVW